jgi:hypothetical protein
MGRPLSPRLTMPTTRLVLAPLPLKWKFQSFSSTSCPFASSFGGRCSRREDSATGRDNGSLAMLARRRSARDSQLQEPVLPGSLSPRVHG